MWDVARGIIIATFILGGLLVGIWGLFGNSEPDFKGIGCVTAPVGLASIVALVALFLA